jgi:hypothetical protein
MPPPAIATSVAGARALDRIQNAEARIRSQGEVENDEVPVRCGDAAYRLRRAPGDLDRVALVAKPLDAMLEERPRRERGQDPRAAGCRVFGTHRQDRPEAVGGTSSET